MVALGTGPLLASRFGWRSIAYLYGTVATAFAVAFTLFGSEAPASVMAAAAAEKAAAEAAAVESTEPKKKETTFEWRIFSVPAVQALVCAQVASNTADYTLSQWAAICDCFLHCHPQAAGVPEVSVLCISVRRLLGGPHRAHRARRSALGDTAGR